MIATSVLMDSGQAISVQSMLTGSATYAGATSNQGAGHTQAKLPANCTLLVIQWDPGNGAKKVYVGDSVITTVDHGYELSASQLVPFQMSSGATNNVPLSAIYVAVDSAATRFNILVV